ncbi:hypothetical protein RJ640_016237 [Escallonia rubra]|uniref:Exportin-4 n=1 Tax=Escallonia rubra TaxID=112253 RepID=A0AA88R0D1_9ASTE|nr:hypothetical protein RJ640_016237 [Escallonia rubra]
MQVKQAVIGSHGLDTQFSGINFLESLVSEFSPSTSTAMGLPREFHEQCRTSLELDYLKAFYCWAQDAALSVANRIIGSNSAVPEVRVCSAALRLMLQILNWDFRYNTNVEGAKKSIDVFSTGVRQDSNSPKRSDYALVQPGSSWHDVLISSGHIEWLLGLYGALRQKFSCEGYWLDCPIAVSSRKLIVQFCSLTGTVFTSDNGHTQGQHLLQILSGIIQWIEPLDAISKAIGLGKSESEMLDGCRALLSIATVTTPLVFDQLLKSIRPFGTLSLLSALMSEVLKDLMANNAEEETWSWVARDILLDTWTTLLLPRDSAGQNTLLPPEGINAAASLFALIVESEMKAASASASSDENEDYLQASIVGMDERLSSYALIAQAAIDVTIPLLTRLFAERFARLHQGRGKSDPTETLEELYSLLLITGHVLADEGLGETPLRSPTYATTAIGSRYDYRVRHTLNLADSGITATKDSPAGAGGVRGVLDAFLLACYAESVDLKGLVIPGQRNPPLGRDKNLPRMPERLDQRRIGYARAMRSFQRQVDGILKRLSTMGIGYAGVPQPIQNHMMESRETEHPVVVLSSSVIKFAEQSLDPEMRASFFSPRLMEAVTWFLARWSCTYLMPSEESGDKARSSENDYEPQLQPHNPKGKSQGFFGEDNQGKAVLDIIVRISTTTLVSYPGEKDLQELACHQLFHGLVRRRNVCAHLVALVPAAFLPLGRQGSSPVTMKHITLITAAAQAVAALPPSCCRTVASPDSWRCLANTFANDRILFSLNATHQRSLAQSLVLSASGMTTPEASNQYVRDLMGHMTAYLVELSGKNDLKDIAQQPDVILLVTCLLERLRGGASASEPRTQKAIYEMGFTAMNPVLIFLEVYKHEISTEPSFVPGTGLDKISGSADVAESSGQQVIGFCSAKIKSAVVYLLLKFVVDWVDAQIIYLEAQETIVVINFCMRLLQLYSSHNIGRMSLSLSSSLLSEANTEKYKDLRALLQLLSNLCAKDLVVYLGLHIVSPLITLDMLKYPKLCHDYFYLLSHMLEVYPEMIVQLNHEALAHVLGNLDFGLHHQDAEVVDMCLRALKALASYHYKEISASKVGLGLHATAYKDPDGNLQDGILSRFLRSLLQFLLFDDYSTDLVSAAADALLPLILCEQDLYQKLGNELIERQGNPAFRSRLVNALQLLTSSNNVSSKLDRPNYQKFRKNLQSFLIEVRGFLRTI